MSEDGDRISAPPRALRRLIEELKDEAVPAVDWERAEARLLGAVDDLPIGDVRPAELDVSRQEMARPEVARSELADAEEAAAEILVPWDEDGADEAWRAVRSPPPALTLLRSGPLPSEEGTPAGGEPRVARGSAPSLTTEARAEARRRPFVGGARGALRRTWGPVAAVAALVAAAAAWLLVPQLSTPPGVTEPVDLGSVAVAPRLVDALDLASLRAGDLVEAVEGPVRFGREGVLSWTLSAGGRVRIVEGLGRDEAGHVVSLESGALEVEVVPQAAATGDSWQERFVVEVGDARVAVHGTAFRVVRSSRGLVVDVTRGVVAVGPRAGGVGSGRRLVAPARGSFGLDGGAYRELPARPASLAMGAEAGPIVDRSSPDERYAGAALTVSEGPSSGGSSSEAQPPRPERSATPGPLGARPAAGAPHDEVTVESGPAPWSADRVRSEVQGCILRTGSGTSSEARVTIASRLVVDVDGVGAARAVRFEPPIRPDLQACAEPVFRARFTPGTGRMAVPIEVSFGGRAR